MRLWLVPLALGLALAGCRPPMHVAAVSPAPLLAGSGDAHASADVGFRSANASLAYAPLSSVGLFLTGDAEPNWGTESFGRERLEGGGGVVVFGSLGASWHGELLAGATRGRVETTGQRSVDSDGYFGFEFVDTREAASSQRLFIQANAAKTMGGGLLGVTLRAEQMRYKGYVYEREGLEPEAARNLQHLFLVPGFFVRLGSGPIVGTYSFGVPVPLQETPYEIASTRMSAGIQLQLDALLRQR